ncbi:hypothetical protein [Vineibacter terrae]|uniref:Uncharacterized protein n=1 Tax=Vineibacter terrae TaxID=2586908 RepID=A0A5C8PHA7_9HYPH|nr:hypothetical protein [Vineibacter terrae]TXL72725.1 hypothetical protein FHP25_24565 [Vineibacter terrae]HEX2885726.1 hypothetical protein [Vineibacter terrae]
MEHRTLDEIKRTALTAPFETATRKMSRREKLERWAALLERHRGALMPLMRVEYLPERARKMLRGDDTPLAVAYKDPLLQAEGLKSDRLGDGMAFFELTDLEAHHLLCDCHYCGTMSGESVAMRARFTANGPNARGLWD